MWRWIALSLLVVTGPLAAETKILAFAGSTRIESYNKKLVHEAAAIAREMGAKVTYIDLRDYPIPFYDGDLEAEDGMPANASYIRQLMIESDGIIIASPEYNGSLSGVLKNVIDWASRKEDATYSNSAFKAKTFAIMSTSPGGGGGARGLKHLRNILENLGGNVVSLEVSVPKAHEVFDSKGNLNDTAMKQELQDEVQQLYQ